MKYQIDTIPVWDALEKDTECFLCEIMKAAEDRYIAYYLGSSVMNPETRVRTNATGFCAEHSLKMLEARKTHHIGLLAHTHLLETMETIRPVLKAMQKGKGPGLLSKNTPVKKLKELLAGRDTGCLICNDMNSTRERYTFTFLHLWEHDTEFRKAFRESKGVCLHHLTGILSMAEKVTAKKVFSEFYPELAMVQEKNLDRLLEEVHWLTQKYKDENAHAGWRGCENAHIRAVKKECGEGRTYY